MEKPVILIVHGAFHRPWHYRGLINGLISEGFTTLAPPNPTSGYDDSIIGKSHHDDVRRIHETLLPYLEKGRKAVVVAHSYGGVPGTAAIEFQTVAERAARGLPGGIVSIVYVAAVVAVNKGVPITGTIGVGLVENDLYTLDDTKMYHKKEALDIFYSDIDEKTKQEAALVLANQSRRCMEEIVQYTIQDIKIPKTYVVCTQDRSLPEEVQRAGAQAGGATVVELDCGHSPFLKQKELELLIRVISEASQA